MDDMARIPRKYLELLNVIARTAGKFIDKCKSDQFVPDGAEDLYRAVMNLKGYEGG